MSLTSESMTPADIAAVTGNNDGLFGGNGSWFIIILFLFAFLGWGGNGFGGGGSGAMQNYVLNSDFATLQRQIDSGFSSMERKGDTITNGLCDGFYTQAQLINGVNTNITQAQIAQMQNANAIQSQLAQCCCDVRQQIGETNYNIATQANGVSRQIERGFCDTNYNMANGTRDIMQSTHADTDRIIARIDAMETARQAERIAQLQNENQSLRFAASQQAQNAYLIDRLNPNPCPQPAYVVQPPKQVTFPNYGCGCNG